MMMTSDSGQKAVEMLKGIAKKTKSSTAKELLQEKELSTACSVAYQLFNEAVDSFKEGDMTWEEAMKDCYENLKAVPMPKRGKKEKSDESYGE